jgi:hypothetical protein
MKKIDAQFYNGFVKQAADQAEMKVNGILRGGYCMGDLFFFTGKASQGHQQVNVNDSLKILTKGNSIAPKRMF